MSFPRTLHRALPLAGLLLVTSAAPALAHDQLQTTNPTDGAVLDAPPARLDLTFSNDVMPLAPVVVLRDATGGDLSSAEPTVEGNLVTLPWPDDVTGGGEFTVAWRVVSSDGHPIEGSFAFTTPVTTTPVTTTPVTTTPATTPPATTTATSPSTAQTVEAAEPPASGEPAATNRNPYLLAGAAALTLGALGALAVRRTRTHTRKDLP